MNAPATPVSIFPDAHAPTAPGLVAWPLIHKLVAFDTTSRESNLALIVGCASDEPQPDGGRARRGGVVRAPGIAAPAIEVDFPDLDRWAAGNTGIPYVWTFSSARRVRTCACRR